MTKPSRPSSLSPEKQRLFSLLLKDEGIDIARTDAIARRPESEPSVLSHAQERMWLIAGLEPGSHYNDSVALKISGRLHLEALQESVDGIVKRHEVLRTTVGNTDGRGFPVVAPRLSIPIRSLDLRALSEEERGFELQRLATEEIQKTIDLSTGPLLRVTLFVLRESEHVLLLVIHQVVNDSWSTTVFLEELQTRYNAIQSGKAPELSELPIQYSDFAFWQRRSLQGERLTKELSYWTTRLSGALPRLELHTDRPRPVLQSFKGATLPLVFSGNALADMKRFCRQEHVTLFIFLLAAMNLLFYRYSAQNDIILGTPIANRDRPEVQGLIGMFINVLVLRTQVTGGIGFRQFLAGVKDVVTEAFEYPNIPFEKLVESLQVERDLSRTPVFQAMLDYKNTPIPKFDFAGLKVERTPVESGMSRTDLTFDLTEADERISGTISYNPDLFDGETIARLAENFKVLIASAMRAPDQSIDELSFVSALERQRLLVELNHTTADYPHESTIHEIFEAQTNSTPNDVAVEFEGREITYRELDQRANQLARRLTGLLDSHGQIVGLLLERSPEMLVGMLGVLKAGAGYLPLDPAFPRDRLRFMLEDSGARLVLSHEAVDVGVLGDGVDTLNLDGDWVRKAASDSPPPRGRSASTDLAYVIYTSGSTGKPKGVQVTHRSVVNFLTSMRKEIDFGSEDVLLAVTTLSFDIAVLELLLPLTVGGRVVIATSETARDGVQLDRAFDRYGITVMQATPASWRLLLDSGWEGRAGVTALSGGEALTADLARQLLARCNRLWNVYGPTETTVWSTSHRIRDVNDAIPIGKPIANTRVYVLDGHGELAPFGIPGELYIGGDGVSKGYLNRPELTAQRFVTDKYGDMPGGKLYRTGDRVRFRSDGNLLYLGRLDNQVKIRGFRIEMGEIEAVLETHPHVQQAVVAMLEERSGDQRLTAYVVLQPGCNSTTTELRRHLAGALPDYMLPQFFVELDSLPKTPNGKIDRKALPPPFDTAMDSAVEHVAPRSGVETSIAEIWQELLAVESIGRHDNFFELGGHSLLAAQAAARIKEKVGTEVTLRSLVVDTLHQIAEECVRSSPAKTVRGGLWPSIVTALRRRVSPNAAKRIDPTAQTQRESGTQTSDKTIHRPVDPSARRERPGLEREYSPPKNALENFIADSWGQILQIDRVGAHDPFFELGGTSIQAAKFTNEMQRQLNENIFVAALFGNPTVSAYAAFLREDYAASVSARFGSPLRRTASHPSLRINARTIADMQAFVPTVPLRRTDSPEPRNRSAIFILAPPRSGTTLLRVMFAGHPLLVTGSELQLLGFETMTERAAAFRGKHRVWLEGVVRLVMELQRCGPDEAARIVGDCEQRGFSTKRFYGVLQEWIGPGRTLLDKSPAYALDRTALERAERDFDRPRYIHLVRHPASSVRSFVDYHLEQVLYLGAHAFSARVLAELVWIVSHQTVHEFLRDIPSERKSFLRFEQLVEAPARSMQEICDDIGLSYHPDMIEPYKNIERKMADGLYENSMPMGDTKLLQRRTIDPSAGQIGDLTDTAAALSDVAWELATTFGYSRPSG